MDDIRVPPSPFYFVRPASRKTFCHCSVGRRGWGDSMTTLLEAALAYAARGWSVIPLRPRDKRPALSSWQEYQQSRATEEAIRSWWERWPDANLGIVTGAVSGLVVLDLDGPEAVAFAKERSVPKTPTVATGKGYHLYFAHPGHPVPNAARLAEFADGGLDVRGDGGYVVAPPSVHPSGRRYAWVKGRSPEDLPLSPLPAWLLELLEARGQAAPTGTADGTGTEPGWVEQLLQGVPEGQRDDAATRLAGHFLAKGLPESEVLALLLAWNQKNTPPLPDKDIKKCVRSVARREAQKPKGARNGVSTRRTPTLVCLADVEPQEVRWLWHPYVPLGKLTILEGDPSAGKTFLALTIAAIVTRGWPFPGQDGKPGEPTTPGVVLYLTAEDGLADTLRPRLDAIGADPSRVIALTGWQAEDGTTGAVTLVDVDILRMALEQHRPVLVVIDPIQAYLGPDVNMNQANETRAVLKHVAALAEEFECAILLIRHLAKSARERAIYRGLGSIDLAAAPRSILLVGQEPGGTGRRVLAHVKSSLAPAGKSLAFEIRDGRLEWAGATDLTATDLLIPEKPEREESALDEAVRWLTELLAPGPMDAKQVKKLAREAGLIGKSDILLRRAKQELGVVARPVKCVFRRKSDTHSD